MRAYDYKALANQFWHEGYLVMEDFFSPSLMNEMQLAILNHYGADPKFEHNKEFLDRAETEVIPWFPQREGQALFDTIEHDARVTKLTGAVLGENWRSQYSMVMYSKNGTKGQAWHQDCPSDNPTLFNMNRLVYTMDVTEASGGAVVIRPGTHRQGVLTVGDGHEDFNDQIVLRPKKGTFVLLHGHTWHRITPIKGDYRVSTNYRCAPVDVPDDITDICVYRNMRYQFSTCKVVEEREF